MSDASTPRLREGDQPPAAVLPADDLDLLAGVAPSFSAFMGRALYDAQFGYYATGQVRFGYDAHFETYPQRLRPLFGRMIAEAAGAALAELAASNEVPDEVPLTILELGAGNGDLAADALDWIVARRDQAPFDTIADRVRYTIGEVSPALRERQARRLAEHIEAGRAEVVAIDARELDWPGSFYGVLVANELIDAFPCEQLRIVSSRQAERIHILGLVGREVEVDASWLVPSASADRWRALLGRDDIAVLSSDGLWAMLADAAARDVLPTCEIVEIAVPLDGGWSDEADGLTDVPEAVRLHLETIAPMVDDLEALGQLPAILCWPTALGEFMEAVGRLLDDVDRIGHAMFIDYGGNARSVLDPRSDLPHLRIFGPDRERRNSAAVYEAPGRYDITFDVDFTAVGHLAERHGLAVHFFGHQAALEQPPVELWTRESQRLLLPGRAEEGIDDPMQQLIHAHELVQRFRQESFRLIVVGSRRVAFPAERLGTPDPWTGPIGLATLSPDVTPEMLREAFADLEVRLGGVDELLHAGGDPLTDLCDRRLYAHREQLLEVLASRGWLVEPGRIASERSTG